MRVTTPSFKAVEGERKVTLPNLLSVSRAVGGVALGVGMAANAVDPTTALVAAGSLAATDAEGLAIVATKRFGRLQEALRIVPSKWGRILDPVADKIYAISIFAGGMANGAIPAEQGIAVLATEASTMLATGIATRRRGGEAPEVGQVNKLGMIARIAMIGANLGAKAAEGGLHDALATTGTLSAIAATALGVASSISIFRQGSATPEQSQ